MEDRQKIEAILAKLNEGKKIPEWDESSDFVMMPSVEIDPKSKAYTLHMDQGLTVKLFINTKTGESRIYWAEALMKDTG